MARLTLKQIKARRPVVDRSKIAATTEEDVARHAVEDDEVPPEAKSARKEGEQER